MRTTVDRPGERVDAGGAPRPIPRALAAVAALVGIVAVVPAGLVALGSALPVDPAVLGPGLLTRADDGALLVLGLLALAWAAWSVVALSIVLEVVAAVRGLPTPRVRGLHGPQRIAGALVAAAAVLVSPGGPSPAVAVPVPVLAQVLDRAPVPQLPGESSAAPSPGPAHADAEAAPEAELPTLTTERHDTLWMLAEAHLGRGERFTEIVELNRGVAQPDGRSLGDDGRLYPGWLLRLPADAVVDVARPERHRVAPGDTLWDIAGEALGDPTRYPEVFAANAGDLQPDGRRLTDPDLIVPGWVLEVPGTGTEPGGAEPGGAEPGGAEPGGAEPGGTEVMPDGAGRTTVPPDPVDAVPPAGVARDSAAPGHEAPSVPTLDRVPSAQPSGPGPSGAQPSAAGPSEPAPVSPSLPPLDRAVVATETPEAAILVPTGGAVAALLLAGLAGELARRRRQFQRFRRPGQRLPRPDEDGRALEVLARAAAAEPGPDLLERALGQLAANTRAEGRLMPPVRLVRATASTVELGLAPGADPIAPIAPFVARDGGRWELDPALLTPEPVDDGSALPGLVTLGTVDDATVLVDLAEVGTLRLAGAGDAVPGVLRALASELTLGPARDWTSRTLCLSDEALSEAIAAAADAGEITLEPDPRRVAALLDAALRRGPGAAGDGDPLELVLADRVIGMAVPGRSGAALITTDPTAPAGAVLDLAADGWAVLQPDGVRLAPQALAASTTRALAGLLAAPLSRGGSVEPAPAEADRGGDAAVASDSSGATALAPAPAPAEPGTAEPATAEPATAEPGTAEPGMATAPRVLLLGEVQVEGAAGPAESTRLGRLAETIAFVLLNPGARPSELQSALWPGRRANPQTCRQMISRARTWLGRTDSGEPYLVPFADTGGRLRLRAEVGSDWADFQALAARGLADPDDTTSLAAALGLVRGRPFGPVAGRELPWADLHLNEMVSLVVDVAHELALRHERAGRWADARDAALRGLRTQCESEALEEIVARLERRT